MKIIATIQADLEVTPLGTRSRLGEELVGVPVLRRTIERVRRVHSVESIHVLCPVAQRERCAALVQGLDVRLCPYDAPPAPWAALVRAARKWSLDGWRGGIGGTTCFDEFLDPRLVHRVMVDVGADVVLGVSPAAVVLDPALAESMIDRSVEVREDTRLMFAPTPPGLSGLVLDGRLVAELAEKNIPVGWVLGYKPDSPVKDLIFQPSCYDISVEARYAVGRMLADTRRSMERLSALLREHENPDCATVGRWLIERERTTIEPLPREVEIELTTDDPYPETLLRPRGARVESRGPIEAGTVQAIVRELAGYDDSLVVLGGFGDPLRHPRFTDVLSAIRDAANDGDALFGLAVRSNAVDLSDAAIGALVTYEVDVLEVTLDAWTADLYRRVQMPDAPDAPESPSAPTDADLEAVISRLDHLAQIRQGQQGAVPIILPHMTKTKDNVAELDDFHDGWIRRMGAVGIGGFSRHGGAMVDRGVINMTPSPREACRRIRSRCVVLSDGRVTMCDQDVQGRYSVGNIGESSLESIWRGAQFHSVRESHGAGRFDATPVCAACDDWHRP